MNWKAVESILSWLVPSALLQGTPWADMWVRTDRERMLLRGFLTHIFVAFVAISHLFIDRQNKLHEHGFFFIGMRLAEAAIAFLFMAVLLVAQKQRYTKLSLGRLCLAATGVVVAGFQAYAMTQSPIIPAFFFPVVAVLATWTLQVGILMSLVYMLSVSFMGVMLSQGLLTADPTFMSTNIVCLFILFASRGTAKRDVELFIQTQEILKKQQKNIELQIELNEQIRAFLPREIYRRVEENIIKMGMTPLQSLDIVLRKRTKFICVMYTDVRGFTASLALNDEYYRTELLDDIRSATDRVERFGGIPRLIGDCILSYHDDGTEVDVVVKAITASFSIHLAQQRDGRHDVVNRYFIISAGEAIVGNIGGYESSREITAIGNAVNLGARVDQLTKQDLFKDIAGDSRVVLTWATYQVLARNDIVVEGTKFDLAGTGLSIRDFPMETCLWIMPTSEANIRILQAWLSRSQPGMMQEDLTTQRGTYAEAISRPQSA